MTIVNGFDKVMVSLGNERRRVRIRTSQTVLTSTRRVQNSQQSLIKIVA